MLRAVSRAMPCLVTRVVPRSLSASVSFPTSPGGNMSAQRSYSMLAIAQSFSVAARFSSDAGTPTSSTTSTLAARETAIDLRSKDVPGVRKWLVETVRLDAEDADILVKHKMDGEQLLKATKAELVTLYGVPGGPAGKILDAVAAIVSPLGAAAAELDVTLTLKSGGKHGATMLCTFTSAADFASYAATHDICLVSKRGIKKRAVLSLADAQRVEAGDYLLRTAPFDSLYDDFNRADHGVNACSDLEQATAKAILTSPSLIAEFGELRPFANGQGIVFFDHSNVWRLEVDGLFVTSESAVVIMNEADQTLTLAHVGQQAPRKAMLELILANPSAYTTKPPVCLEALRGIAEVVPVISGYNFRPDVEAACKAAGVRCVKTDSSDYAVSSALKQTTTNAILTSPSLIAEFGELRSFADGQGIVFFDDSDKFTLEVDGLVVSADVVILNEARQTPTLADVGMQALRKAMLERILADPSAYRTKPPVGLELEALGGITEVVPVISGCNVSPEVEAACLAAGVRCLKINGSDYGSAI